MTATSGAEALNWGHTRGHRQMKKIPYLMQKRGLYYARFRTPRRLLPWLNQQEIRWPLATCRLTTARHRLHLASLMILDMLRQIDVEIAHQPLTEDEMTAIKARIFSIKAEKLQAFKKILADGDAGPLDARDFLQRQQSWLTTLNAAIEHNHYDQPEVIWQASEVLSAVDRLAYDFSSNNPNLHYLGRQFCASMQAVHQEMLQLLRNPPKPSVEPTEAPSKSEPPIVSAAPLVESVNSASHELRSTVLKIERISVIVEAYLADLQGRKRQAKTLAAYRGEYTRFIEFSQDIRCDRVTRDVVREFRTALQRYPKKVSSLQLQQPFTTRLVPTDSATPTLTAPTIDKHIDRLGQLFSWAQLEGYEIADRLTERMSTDHNRRDRDARDRFDVEDLGVLFSTPEYLGEKAFQRTAFYWAPLIALYTGARIEEICQLHTNDLGLENGIHYFDFNDNDGKKLKPGQATKRLVPMHSKLVQLGLPVYVNALRKAGHTQLFPTLNPHQLNGMSHAVTRWFSAYKQRLGFGPKQVFHSFRHTVTDESLQTDMNEMVTNAIVGHTGNGTMSVRRYGKGMRLQQLAPKIESLQFTIMAKPYTECQFAKAEMAALCDSEAAARLKKERMQAGQARKAAKTSL